MTHVTKSEARALGRKHGADRLVIVQVQDDGRWAITTWGKDKATCAALKRLLDKDPDFAEWLARAVLEAK